MNTPPVSRRTFLTATSATLFLGTLRPSLLLGAEAEKTLTLGAAVSFTGSFATLGGYVRDGYDFVLKQINARGGIARGGTRYRLAIKYYDDESTPAKARDLMERLITVDKIQYILGPYGSPITLAASPITEKHGIPMVEGNGASNDIFARGYTHIFATLSTADQYCLSAVDLAATFTSPKVRKAVIAVKNDNFSLDVGQGTVERCKKVGIEVALHEKFPENVKDLSPLMARIKEIRPELFIVSGHEVGATLATKQLHEFRVDVPMVVVTHADGAKLRSNLGRVADYIYTPDQWSREASFKDDLFGTPAQFAAQFKKEYGYEPPYQVAESAACVMVYADALRRAADLSPAAVTAALRETDLMTFFGQVKFDDKGRNIAKPMVLYQYQGDASALVAPPDYASAKPLYPAPPWSARKV